MSSDVVPVAKSSTVSGMVLRSDRLRVDIATPGTLYRGSRFDWTGLITQVTLDGRHTFCVPEGIHATSIGGIGLCNEFGIFHPIGYYDAAIGEQFPKLGVGLLTKLDGSDYRFNFRYPIEPFPIVVNQNGDCDVEFVVSPVDCRGYAASLVKRVSVRATELTIGYELTNTGKQRLATREYNHNFLSIDVQVGDRGLPDRAGFGRDSQMAASAEGTVLRPQRCRPA
jgi:hypothetical protein